MDKKTFKNINKMALPVLMSSLVEIIFGIADQGIIGRTSVEGYAAVGVVANLIYAITGTLGSLSIAFVILFGKAIGDEDEDAYELRCHRCEPVCCWNRHSRRVCRGWCDVYGAGWWVCLQVL